MAEKDPWASALKEGKRNYKIKSQKIEVKKAGRPTGEPKQKTSLYLKTTNTTKMEWLMAGYPLPTSKSHIMDMALEELFKKKEIAKYLKFGRGRIEQLDATQ